MKRTGVIAIVVAVSLVASLITFYVLELSSIIQVEEYPMRVELDDSNVAGFNVDPTGFYFGGVPLGSGAERFFMIQDVPEDVVVSIETTGEMGSWVSYPDNFEMDAGDSKNITFTLDAPSDAAIGNYTGTVTVILKRR